jgi:ribosomal protein S12 methylthiotransferase
MANLFRDEIEQAAPEAEVLVGVRDLLALRGRLEGGSPRVTGDATAANPRLVTTPGYAYLKVADGCSRQCAFCIIPRIRGRQRSRPADDVIAEAHGLVAAGARELVLVAQDLTHWGADLPGKPRLADLLRRLADEVPGAAWIRPMYLYPRDLDDDLLEVVAGHPRVLKYLDLPVQHGDDGVLRAMRRGTTGRDLLALVDRIRARVPGVVLRTSYLVGFPGETDAAFENLLAFAGRARFEMAGVFRFSAEPGARATGLSGQVPAAARKERASRLEARLSEIAAEVRAGWTGREHEAVVEGRSRDGVVGRLWFQAPEIDGVVRVKGLKADPGAVLRVRITGARGNDLEAVPA